VLLGGRVAEQIVFGSITTGAADDLNRSPRSPARWCTSMRWERACTRRGLSVDGDELADSTRRMRDQEQRDLADQAYRAAYALIEAHRSKLDELAETSCTTRCSSARRSTRSMDGVRPVKRPVHA
jgi:cell division protease FtsH